MITAPAPALYWVLIAIFAALLLGAVMMCGATLGSELAWFIPALASYLITIISPTWRANVTSIYHAWRDRDGPLH
jgi:hypothetical protein